MPETTLDPKTSARIVQENQPGGQSWRAPGSSEENPEAPDIGGAPVPSPSASALGGNIGQPAKPHQGVTDRIANFVSGGQATPGSVWRGILGGALTGMVAGAGQPHMGPGIAAGGQAAQKQRQQQFENRLTLTREQEQQKVRQAQIVQLTNEATHQAMLATEKKLQMGNEFVERENAFNARMGETPGNQVLGQFRNMDDVIEHSKNNPELANELARGEILVTPHVIEEKDADGKPTGKYIQDGVTAAHVKPDWLKQKIEKDITVPRSNFVPAKQSGDPGTWEDRTFTAGTVTNADVETYRTQASRDAAKFENDANQTKAQAALARAQIAAKGKPGDLTDDDVTELGKLMAADPSRLDLKTLVGLRGNARAKVFLAAHRADPNFDPRRATLALKTMEDFTTGDVAKNLSAFNPAIRHLAMLGDAAVALGNHDTVWLNRIGNELGLELGGKSDLAVYNAIHAAVTGEVGKVYKGSSPTDQEITIMNDAFSSAQNPAASAAAVNTTMRLMGEKVQDYYRRFHNGTQQTPEQNGIELVSPDVQQALSRHGITSINPSGPPVNIQQQQPPPGSTPGYDKAGKLAGWMLNGVWVPLGR